MAASEPGPILSESAAEVLESMFFTTLNGDVEPGAAWPEPWVSAALSFHGDPSGRFGIRTPLETGRRMAASFLGLGEEKPTESQTGEVPCELANILCGSVLSRLEKHSRFELSQPELEPPERSRGEKATVFRAFELDEGPLAAWLDLEQAG